MGSKWTDARQATVEEFFEWADSEGLTNRDLAALLDCSPGVISQLRSQTYDGDVAKYVGRARQVLRRQHRRESAPIEPEFVKTETASQVLNGLVSAHTERTLVFVVGPTGIGKTASAMNYCRKEDAARYLATGEACSPRSLVGALADLLDVETSGRSTWSLRRDVSRSLQGSDQLLVLDEVDYLPEKTYQTVRQIHDSAECGVVLVGTPACLKRLRESKSDTVAQIMGRVARVVQLGSCPDRDLRMIAAQWELGQETVDALVEASAGQARRLTQILRAAQRRCDLDEMDAETVRDAAGELMSPVSV